MTIVSVKKNDLQFIHFKISGHSEFSNIGSDIVCSAISSMATITINAIDKFNKEAIRITTKESLIDIIVVSNDDITNTLLENLLEHLISLSVSYPNNLKIEVKEG